MDLQKSFFGHFKKFLVRKFQYKKNKNKPGLLTGYYEPLINVSNSKDNIFKFPILKENKNYL